MTVCAGYYVCCYMTMYKQLQPVIVCAGYYVCCYMTMYKQLQPVIVCGRYFGVYYTFVRLKFINMAFL